MKIVFYQGFFKAF